MLSDASYDSRFLSAPLADELTIAILLIGASGLLLRTKGIHWTLRRVIPWGAGAITVLLWTPLTLSPATYFHALPVFRSWA